MRMIGRWVILQREPLWPVVLLNSPFLGTCVNGFDTGREQNWDPIEANATKN